MTATFHLLALAVQLEEEAESYERTGESLRRLCMWPIGTFLRRRCRQRAWLFREFAQTVRNAAKRCEETP